MQTGSSISRAFVRVGQRMVHYRRLGVGPPVVMIHGSPASSEVLAAEMRQLADRHTCFAFDTPGFGDSEPLPELPDGIGSLADALAETLLVMRFPACPVYGTHTGAAIALELGWRHPLLVTGLVLDAVALFTEAEQEALFEGYFEPFVADALGGHFAHTWTRFRDLFTWFPWTRRDPAALNETDSPSPSRLQLWVMMFYRAAHTYAGPYRAAIRYGSAAQARIATLRVPAAFMASEPDMLYPHLNRLPSLAANQTILRTRRADHLASISAALSGFASNSSAPDDHALTFSPGVRTQQFVQLGNGPMLVRCFAPNGPAADSRATPAVLLLHDSPGTGRCLEDLARSIARTARVVLPDLPGCGESPGIGDRPPLGDFCDRLRELIEVLRLERVILYGRGLGASLAIELCQRLATRAAGLCLDGVLLPDATLRARLQREHSPRITIDADGGHWYRTWLMLRDRLVYFPWFDRRREALRRVPADFDAQHLHDLTVEVMKQPGCWHEFSEAALMYDPQGALMTLRTSIPGLAISCVADPLHPFSVFQPRLRRLLPTAHWTELSCDCLDPAGRIANLTQAILQPARR